MLKITRLYNQNRRKVWGIAIIVIFIIAIVQLLNSAYRNTNSMIKESNEDNVTESNIVDYDKARNSIVSGGKIYKETSDEIQKTLENFLVYCCNQQIEEAYSLLTDDCKEILYPSIKDFNDNYCKDIYEKRRTYTFQSWSSVDHTYIYLVKIFEDMLSTGRDTTKNYLQDYITVIYENGQYLLNINKFIKVKNIDKEKEVQDVKVRVISSQMYIDYEYYEIEITNNREKEIILDPLKEDNSTYVQDQNRVKIRALLYENKEEEFKIAPGETKKIKIKFNNSFIASNKISKVVFSSIILDQEKYLQDEDKEDIKVQIEVNL